VNGFEAGIRSGRYGWWEFSRGGKSSSAVLRSARRLRSMALQNANLTRKPS